MHCGDQRHLGLCLGYVPALAYGSCRVSDQGTTLRASDLHNARATILNPFNRAHYDVIVMHTSRSYWILHKYSRSRGTCLVRREANNISLHKIRHFFDESHVSGPLFILKFSEGWIPHVLGFQEAPHDPVTRDDGHSIKRGNWWPYIVWNYAMPCVLKTQRTQELIEAQTHHPHTPSSEIPNYYVKLNQRKFGSSLS